MTTAPVQASTAVAPTTPTVPKLGDVLLATLSDPDFAAEGTIAGGFDILGTAIPFIGEVEASPVISREDRYDTNGGGPSSTPPLVGYLASREAS